MYIKIGDSVPMHLVFTGQYGSVMDLTGLSVRVIIKELINEDFAIHDHIIASHTDAENGITDYVIPASETANYTEGLYNLYVQVVSGQNTFSSSVVPLQIGYNNPNNDVRHKLTIDDMDIGVQINHVIKNVDGGSDKHFEFIQASPATTWNIQHNLGKKPNVFIQDSEGDTVRAKIIHQDNNNLTINYNVATAGRAILN